MNATPDLAVSRLAGAIGEPARARMLCALLDGHARTATELALVAEVSPSTASVHLGRLKTAGLVSVAAQGKHRYYALAGSHVADVLEGLSVLAGGRSRPLEVRTPTHLRLARTCYDHIAGRLGVLLHQRLRALGWLVAANQGKTYEVSGAGARELGRLGADMEAARALRRRFAYPCLDWSERQPHLGGAAGAALLAAALKQRWVVREDDSRSLRITNRGRSEMLDRLGVKLPNVSDGASF